MQLKTIFSLLVAAATAGHAAIIGQQLDGSIDPAGNSDVDTTASGSVTLADFNSATANNKIIQANWTGISGATGNTIDGPDVDVRVDHTVGGVPASVSTAQNFNTSTAGNGYLWSGTSGQQVSILFGTQDGSFSNDRTVKAAGLVLLNFGSAYTDVTIKYLDPDDNVLSTQNFVGTGDSQGEAFGGADFFTGYISTSQNIAKITIDLTRNPENSNISLDAVTYMVVPEVISTIPADDAIDVPVDTNLTATFSRPIAAGSGTIEIRRTADDSLFADFAATSSSVSVTGDQVIIDPPSDLGPGTGYYVVFPSGTFEDTSAAPASDADALLAGEWSFTTPTAETATVDFDPSGEFASQFSGGSYSETATGGLDSSVGITIVGGSPTDVTTFDGTQSSWFPAGTFGDSSTMTVGAFFNPSSFATSAEVLRLGLTNGGADTFSQLPFASILWNGSAAQLDVRSESVTDPTTFPLSTGQWYYFEVSFTRVGTSNSIIYELTVANADSSGNVGSTIQSFSVTDNTSLTTTELNKDIYAGFRGMVSAGVLDNFYASRVGASQLSAGSTFAAWIAGFPGVGGQNGVDDDPDGDGNDNGVENFFGTAPDEFSSGLVAGEASGNTFTFTHPQGTLADDLTAAYRWSKDLQAFEADGATDGAGTTVTFTTQADTPVAGTTTVTATVTGTATNQLYVIVEVN